MEMRDCDNPECGQQIPAHSPWCKHCNGFQKTCASTQRKRHTTRYDLVRYQGSRVALGGYPPGLPQIRTCAIDASGSSSYVFASPCYTE